MPFIGFRSVSFGVECVEHGVKVPPRAVIENLFEMEVKCHVVDAASFIAHSPEIDSEIMS